MGLCLMGQLVRMTGQYTAHVARLLDLPVLLVIDCSRLSRSVAAWLFLVDPLVC